MLTGEGKAFCSGGDLKLFRENMQPHPQDIVRQLIKVFNIIIMGLRQMPKPVVAVINGPLGGGGFSLAAACDIRIAARSAIFRQAYTSISLVPDGAWTSRGSHADRFREGHGARAARPGALRTAGAGLGAR